MVDTRDYPLSRRSLFAGAIACTGLVLVTALRGAMAQASPEAIATRSTSDGGVTPAPACLSGLTTALRPA